MSAAEDNDHNDHLLNMVIWNNLRPPNPKHTKGFKRGGGFSGTAVSGNTFYMDDGSIIGNTITHVVRGYLTYLCDGEWANTSEQFGQTTYVGKNKYGMFTDEEAPKKSATDLMSKCASLIGVAADIHLGLFDDNKYVNAVKEQFEAGSPEAQLIDGYIAVITAAADRKALEATLNEEAPNGVTWQKVLETLAKTHISMVQKAKQQYAKKLRSFAPAEAAE